MAERPCQATDSEGAKVAARVRMLDCQADTLQQHAGQPAQRNRWHMQLVSTETASLAPSNIQRIGGLPAALR